MTSGDEKGSGRRMLVLYGLYSFVAVLVLLHLKFPSDAVRNYVELTVERRFSPMALRVGSVDLELPPGLVFKDVRLSRRDGPGKVFFSAGDLRIRPEPGKLLRGTPSAAVHCSAYGGSISGAVSLAGLRLHGPVAADMELNGIRIEDNAAIQEYIGRAVRGVLDGTVSFSGPPEDPWTGDAEIRLVARDGNFEIMQPFLGLKDLDFSRVVLNGDLKDRRFNLTHGDIEGPDYRGSLTGTVMPAENLTESRVNLQGWIEPFPSFFTRKEAASALVFVRQWLRQGKLNFSIQGTLGNPVFNIG